MIKLWETNLDNTLVNAELMSGTGPRAQPRVWWTKSIGCGLWLRSHWRLMQWTALACVCNSGSALVVALVCCCIGGQVLDIVQVQDARKGVYRLSRRCAASILAWRGFRPSPFWRGRCRYSDDWCSDDLCSDNQCSGNWPGGISVGIRLGADGLLRILHSPVLVSLGLG
jgi:hypothetical protein